MSNLNAILLALDVARRRRDQVVVQLLAVQSQRLAAQGQLNQLDSYALETRDKWAVGARVQTTPEVLHHYHQFMERLQQAIDLQQQALVRHDNALAEQHRVLLQVDIRIAGLERLLEKRHREANRLLSSREQKQLDELAAQQYRRHRETLESMGAS